MTGVKNGVGHNQISVDEAMYIGFAISIPTAFHKTTKKFFENAAKSACAAPKAIGDDMRLYYVKEMVKQYTTNTQICLATTAKSINDNARATSNRAKMEFKKIFGRGGPKP